ncbi:MAG: glycosyltransferase N-terminal domain-containing protein [bacterium]
MSFSLILFNTLLVLFIPVIILVMGIPRLFRYIKRNRGTFLRRFRVPPGEILPGGVLFQASSIGEVKIALPVARKLRAKGFPVYIFTVTPEGRLMAAGSGAFDGSFLAPFDVFFVAGKFLKKFAPGCVVLIELQLWPNLIAQAARVSKVVILNGRISDRSFPRYRLVRPFVKKLLGLISVISARTEKDRRRFISLGAAPGKVKLTGNIKYDTLLTTPAAFKAKEAFGVPHRLPVITAGSTHGGEEEMIVNAVLRIMKDRELLCVIAPRHIERIPLSRKIAQEE